MAGLELIAAAIKEIDSKKENLKKAYDELQSHSPLLSSFSLSWSDLDAYFTNIQNSIAKRFRLLESLQSQSQATRPRDPSSSNLARLDPSDTVFHSPAPPLQDPSSSQPPSRPELELKTQFESQPEPSSSSKQDQSDSVAARPELRTLCEEMDGKGLIKFINENSKDRESLRVQLPAAIRVAMNPGWMVLDAIEGFYGADDDAKSDKDPALCGIRRACLLLLEVLIGINVNIGKEVRERAKNLAFTWKEKVNLDGDKNLKVLGFLHLVAAYGLGCEFEMNDLVEFLVIVAKNRQSTLLCKAMDLGDKAQDLIQKLIDDGKQLLAVKYIFELDLTDKYPPVLLLKAYLKESKKLAKNFCKHRKNTLKPQNEATAKQQRALKAVIKVIEDYKLESEYPKETLQKRIEHLEKLTASRNRPTAASAPAPAPKPQWQQPRKLRRSGNKRRRIPASFGYAQPSVSGANITVPLFQEPHVQPAGLLPENSAAYLGSEAEPYGLVSPSPAVASYGGSSIGMYGLTGAHVGFPGNSNYAASHLYSTESHMPSGYYDRSTPYGGYGLPPQYHPSYYPQ